MQGSPWLLDHRRKGRQATTTLLRTLRARPAPAKRLDFLVLAGENAPMQLRHLKTFAAVASTLNITRAAEQVHLAQSSVTEQIQSLEADLGAALFERSRRGLALTEAGKRLLEFAGRLRTLADDARAAVADAAGLIGGSLTIGALETLCSSFLPPLVARCRQQFPTIGLTLRAAGSSDLRNGVRSGDLDLCFAFGTMPDDQEINSETVGQDGLVIIMPQAHPLSHRKAISLAELKNEAFLVTEAGCVYRRMFEDAFEAAGCGLPPIAADVGSLAAILRMAGAGLGCALVPSLAVRQPLNGIEMLPSDGPEVLVPIVMAWRNRRVLRPALRQLLEIARSSDTATIPAGVRPRHAAPCP